MRDFTGFAVDSKHQKESTVIVGLSLDHRKNIAIESARFHSYYWRPLRMPRIHRLASSLSTLSSNCEEAGRLIRRIRFRAAGFKEQSLGEAQGLLREDP